MKKIKTFFLLLLVITVQYQLIRNCYGGIFNSPNEFVHCDMYDGLKNLFTMHTYIHDTDNPTTMKYRFMNYPFGDCVTYTDNTPLFSVLFKMFAANNSNLLNNDVGVFNFILIFNLLLSSVLLFFILLKFIDSTVLLVLFSVCLAWTNPQFIRLGGTPNLSLSSIVLATILLLIYFADHKNSKIKTWFLGISLVLILYLSFFVHVYFLFITAFTTAFFLFFDGVISKKTTSLVAAFLIPVSGFALSYASMHFMDDWLAIRTNDVMGYGYDNWELTLMAMLTPYQHLSFAKLIPNYSYPYDSEARCYMGGFVSFSFFLTIILFLVNRYRNNGARLFPESARYLSTLFLCTSFFLVVIALGEQGYIFRMRHKYINIIDPFLYLRPLVPALSHIRYVVRFLFPAFFMINMITLSALLFQLRFYHSVFKYVVLAIGISLLCIETHDEIKSVYCPQNPFAEKFIQEHLKIPAFAYDSFQAILPIPYYHVGSARWDYTIETDEDFFTKTMMISSHTHLPLMSCKMSRTLNAQNMALVDIFINGVIPDSILHLMNSKPVLIVKDKWNSSISTSGIKPDHEPILTAFKCGDSFPEKAKAELFYSDEQYNYYKWNVAK